MSLKDENEALYHRLRAGENVRDELVLLNLPLVTHKVESFVVERPNISYLWQDLISAARLKLVQAVNDLADADYVPETINPAVFLGNAISNSLIDVANKAMTFGPSRFSHRRAVDAGTEFVASRQIPLDKIHEEPGRRNDRRHGGRPMVTAEPQNDPRVMLGLREQIDDCCETEMERTVVDMRAQGHTDLEIALKLGVSESTVLRARNRVYRCFLEGNEEWER